MLLAGGGFDDPRGVQLCAARPKYKRRTAEQKRFGSGNLRGAWIWGECC
jgi:hypothetical protein